MRDALQGSRARRCEKKCSGWGSIVVNIKRVDIMKHWPLDTKPARDQDATLSRYDVDFILAKTNGVKEAKIKSNAVKE